MVLTAVDPREPNVEFKWVDVGMLDYDETSKLYLVQRVNKQGRVIDGAGKTVVNGGILEDGTSISLYRYYIQGCICWRSGVWIRVR